MLGSTTKSRPLWSGSTSARPNVPYHLPVIPVSCSECLIRTTTICQPFTDGRLEIISDCKSGDRTLRRGVTMCEQGEPARHLYNLLDGWLVVSVLLNAGQRRVLDIRLPGAFLGVDSLYPPAVCHTTVEAVTDASVCRIPTAKFRPLVHEHAELGQRLNELAVGQSLRLQNRLAHTGHTRSRSRLAYFILDLFERAELFSPSFVEGSCMLWPLTQEMVGDALGLTSVQISNTFKALRDDGALSIERGKLNILNRALLEYIGHYESHEHLLLP